MPSPTYVYFDLMTSYSPGGGVPTGFWASPGSSDQFLDAFNGRSGVVFQAVIGQIYYPTSNLVADTAVPSASIFWTGLGPPAGIELFVTDPISEEQQLLASLIVQSDYSISLILYGGNFVNTLQQVVFQNTWQYYELDVVIGSIVNLGVECYTVSAVLTIDGVQVLTTGGALASQLPVNSNVGVKINQFSYTTGYYAEIAATNAAQTPPYYINPGETINARVSQVIAEAAFNLTPNNARVSQVIVEDLYGPDPNARVSQAIVEIITQNGLNPVGTPYVRES